MCVCLGMKIRRPATMCWLCIYIRIFITAEINRKPQQISAVGLLSRTLQLVLSHTHLSILWCPWPWGFCTWWQWVWVCLRWAGSKVRTWSPQGQRFPEGTHTHTNTQIQLYSCDFNWSDVSLPRKAPLAFWFKSYIYQICSLCRISNVTSLTFPPSSGKTWRAVVSVSHRVITSCQQEKDLWLDCIWIVFPWDKQAVSSCVWLMLS